MLLQTKVNTDIHVDTKKKKKNEKQVNKQYQL